MSDKIVIELEFLKKKRFDNLRIEVSDIHQTELEYRRIISNGTNRDIERYVFVLHNEKNQTIPVCMALRNKLNVIKVKKYKKADNNTYNIIVSS